MPLYPYTTDQQISILSGPGIDPTGATDSFAAVQAKINAGGAVYHPGGTLLLSQPLTLPSNFDLSGAGDLLSIFKMSNGSNSAITYNGGGNHIRVHDLQFDGGTTSAATNSLLFDGTTDVSVRRCRFKNMKTAIWLNNSSGTPARYQIRDNYFESVVDFAVRAMDGIAADVVIEDNYVAGVTGSSTPVAFRYSGTGGIFRNNRIAATADTGIMLVGTNNCVIDGNIITSTLVSIFVGTGAKRTSIANNNVQSASDFGIHLADSTQTKSETVVVGNVIHDCGKSGISCEGVESIAILANTILRVGITGTQNNWKSGVVVTANASVNCAKVTVVGNVIRDDQTTPTMRYGILQETSTSDFQLGHNSVSGATIANTQLLTPAAVAGSNAGTTPPAPVIAGDDWNGRITFGTGASPAAGNMVSVTFNSPYTTVPDVVLTSKNSVTPALNPYLVSVSLTGFVIGAAVAPTASKANTYYSIGYNVLRAV